MTLQKGGMGVTVWVNGCGVLQYYTPHYTPHYTPTSIHLAAKPRRQAVLTKQRPGREASGAGQKADP